MSNLTKMTFKVYAPLWENFDAQISRLPVKRDPFLSGVIRSETPRLRAAMEGKRLSGKANRWVSNQLNRLKTTTVNVGIERDVADELKHVIEKTHMVRDAFFNRMILFLRSSDKLLDYFNIPKKVDGRLGRNYGSDLYSPTSPMATFAEVFDDPLWYLHMAVEELEDTSLYLLRFSSSETDGFSCWMDDADVQGTRSNRRARAENEKFYLDLQKLENDFFSPTKDDKE